MNLQSYVATFGMVALSVVTVGGCTVNTTTDNGDAADNMDTGTGATEPDTGTAVDTGTVADSGTPPGADADASDSAASCSVAPATGSTTCDTCLDSMCCSQLEACYGTDSGAGSCVALVSCVQDCEAGNPDAGVAPDTQSDCLANICAPDGGIYTPADKTNAIALLACLGDSDAGANLCGTACGM